MIKQEIIAGIILGCIGMCLLIVPSDTLWNATEKWKVKGNAQPSSQYIVVARILGIVFTGVSGWLLVSGR